MKCFVASLPFEASREVSPSETAVCRSVTSLEVFFNSLQVLVVCVVMFVGYFGKSS